MVKKFIVIFTAFALLVAFSKTALSIDLDTDGDGFSDSLENYIGTNPNVSCGFNAWPLDFDNNRAVTVVDIFAVAAKFGTTDPRFDLNGDGGVNLQDIFKVSQSFGQTCSYLFRDDFNGPTLNTNIWEFFSTNGGNYSFDNGSIVVPGGTSMFYIRSKNNPFPADGHFTLEFGIQYTTVDESGVGVAVGFEQQNGYDALNVPVAYWQGSNFGLQVVRFGLTEAVIGSNPDLNYHIGKITYDGDKYHVFLDGVLKYTSPPSATAKSLWFGNPFCCRSNWTGFKLDYIKVTQP